jgi:small subunit ribosomal protein S11
MAKAEAKRPASSEGKKGPNKALAKRARKKVKRVITTGAVHVLASFNNTIITVTDSQGNVIAWQTSGGAGFKGSRKSTPYAAQMAARKAIQTAREFGLKTVDVFVRGPGPGRESAVRAVGEFCIVLRIVDKTGIPHNGCRPSKERRV